jgi:hypothetical protein
LSTGARGDGRVEAIRVPYRLAWREGHPYLSQKLPASTARPGHVTVDVALNFLGCNIFRVLEFKIFWN